MPQKIMLSVTKDEKKLHSLEDFAKEFSLFTPNTGYDCQGNGWYRLVEMVKKDIKPNKENMWNFHKLIRPYIIHYWEDIKLLPIMCENLQ